MTERATTVTHGNSTSKKALATFLGAEKSPGGRCRRCSAARRSPRRRPVVLPPRGGGGPAPPLAHSYRSSPPLALPRTDTSSCHWPSFRLTCRTTIRQKPAAGIATNSSGQCFAGSASSINAPIPKKNTPRKATKLRAALTLRVIALPLDPCCGLDLGCCVYSGSSPGCLGATQNTRRVNSPCALCGAPGNSTE